MNNVKKWIKRGVLAVLLAAVAYAVVVSINIVVVSASWAEAKMDINRIAGCDKCFAEYEGETLQLCDKAWDVMHKFLLAGKATDWEKPSGDGRVMILTTEAGTLTLTEDTAEDVERGIYLCIESDGEVKYYHLSMQVGFEHFVRVFEGSAVKNYRIKDT